MAVTFDETLWDELGLETIDDDTKQELLGKLAETVQNRVSLRLGDELSAHELDTFEKTLEERGEDAAIGYLEAIYPNYTLVVQEEVQRLKAELTQEAAELTAQANEEDEA